MIIVNIIRSALANWLCNYYITRYAHTALFINSSMEIYSNNAVNLQKEECKLKHRPKNVAHLKKNLLLVFYFVRIVNRSLLL